MTEEDEEARRRREMEEGYLSRQHERGEAMRRFILWILAAILAVGIGLFAFAWRSRD